MAKKNSRAESRRRRDAEIRFRFPELFYRIYRRKLRIEDEINSPRLRRILARLQGARKDAYSLYSSFCATRKTGQRTSKMGKLFHPRSLRSARTHEFIGVEPSLRGRGGGGLISSNMQWDFHINKWRLVQRKWCIVALGRSCAGGGVQKRRFEAIFLHPLFGSGRQNEKFRKRRAVNR